MLKHTITCSLLLFSVFGFAQTPQNSGIGTANPQSKLEVRSIGNDSTKSALNITDSDSKSLLFVRNDGKVGVGTKFPSANFNVFGNTGNLETKLFSVSNSLLGNFFYAKENGDIHIKKAIFFDAESTSSINGRNGGAGGSIQFTDKLQFNVGVEGFATINGHLRFNEGKGLSDADGYTSLSFVTGTGYGVERYTITGNNLVFYQASRNQIAFVNNAIFRINANNSTTNNSNYFSWQHNTADELMRLAEDGQLKINNLSGTGSRMVVADANGILSTQAIPGAGTSFYYPNNCIFIGIDAGLVNTGAHNIFFGKSSGKVNTSGSYNVFFGSETGYSNTTGMGNLFIGATAGYANTAGNNNTFIGASAGANTTTGSNNIYIGKEAGAANIVSVSNTIIGNYAGWKLTTADNVLIGAAAGRETTTGERNIMIGKEAGFSNTTGTRNMFIGFNTGANNNTGSYLTLLGNTADVEDVNYNSSMALGYGAKIKGNNQIVFGDDVAPYSEIYLGRGVSANTLGATSIMASSANGTDGSAANSKLYIAGARGRGTGDGGEIIFQTAPASTTSAATLNTLLDRLSIRTDGTLKINNLSGTGSRMVVADANGVLSTQAIPGGGSGGSGQWTESGTDIYRVNGKVGIGSNSPTAFLDIAGSTTSSASLRLREGLAPTTPKVGDIWFDGSGIFFSPNGAAYRILSTAGFNQGYQIPFVNATADNFVSASGFTRDGNGTLNNSNNSAQPAAKFENANGTGIYASSESAYGALIKTNSDASGVIGLNSNNVSGYGLEARAENTSITGIRPALLVSSQSANTNPAVGIGTAIDFATNYSGYGAGVTYVQQGMVTTDVGTYTRRADFYISTLNGTNGNLVERLRITGGTGNVQLSSLTGTGSRMVVADANGVLSTQAIPGGGSGGSLTGTPYQVLFFNTDGTITSQNKFRFENGLIINGANAEMYKAISASNTNVDGRVSITQQVGNGPEFHQFVTGSNYSSGNNFPLTNIPHQNAVFFDWNSGMNRMILKDQSTFFAPTFTGGVGVHIHTNTSSGGVLIGDLSNLSSLPTAYLDIKGSTVLSASLRLRSGVAPTSPNDGDIWYDGSNLKFRKGTNTVDLTGVSGGSGAWTESGTDIYRLNGKVGIGTSTPQYHLHQVAPMGTTDGYMYMFEDGHKKQYLEAFGSGDKVRMVLRGDYGMGIRLFKGSSNRYADFSYDEYAANELSIRGSNANDIIGLYNPTFLYNELRFGQNSNALVATITQSGDNNSGNLSFKNKRSGDGQLYTNLYIENSGKVGVGTTTPVSKLDINGSLSYKVVNINTNYTAADETILIADASSGNITITLPAASSVDGRTYTIKKSTAANQVIVDGNGGETIDGAATKTLSAQYAKLTIVSNGGNWFVIED